MPKKTKKPIKNYSKFIVKIHDNEYMTVAGRIKMFWDSVKEKGVAGSIITEATQNNDRITVKATAKIAIDDLVVAQATGHAAEIIGANYINKTSALENAETSAVGRALGNLGIGILGAGGIASAEEVKKSTVENLEDEINPQKPSQKQIAFIEKLADETGEDIPDILSEDFTRAKASSLIEKLLSIQKDIESAKKEALKLGNEEIPLPTEDDEPPF